MTRQIQSERQLLERQPLALAQPRDHGRCCHRLATHSPKHVAHADVPVTGRLFGAVNRLIEFGQQSATNLIDRFVIGGELVERA